MDPVTLISNNKLKLNRNSDDYYKQHLVLLKELPLRNTNSSEKHMRECFNWYYDRIKKEFNTGESLAAFIDNIVDKLFFTVIEVTDQLNAFKVFETLNARGVKLSPSDLLKNYLFSNLLENSSFLPGVLNPAPPSEISGVLIFFHMQRPYFGEFFLAKAGV